MRSQIELIHQREQESMAVKEQIAELQKALSDSHLAIYDERNYFLQLKRDQELLFEQDRTNRKKMAEVAEMEADIRKQQEIAKKEPLKNFKDVRPQALAKNAVKGGSIRPTQPKQNVMTNALIAEKLTEDDSARSLK